MMSSEHGVKQALLRALDELPREQIEEVLDFVLFLNTRRAKNSAQTLATPAPTGLRLRTLPASHLDALTGLVAWGGDAVADAERLYEDSL